MTHNEASTGLLGIPEQKSDTGMEIRPKYIAKWIDSLPRANVGETAKLVYKNLHRLNRTQISDVNRYKILELFWEPTSFLTEALKKHYLGLSFPLPAKKQQVALLSREIRAEMAIGYKIIAEGKLTGQNSRLDNKMLAMTIYHAIHYLGAVLRGSYQIYVPEPASIWKQIYRLYLHAQQNDFSDSSLAPGGGKHEPQVTINSLFKQILLLSLASPYRMRQGDVEKIGNFLLQWSSYAQISELVDPDQCTGMYSFNLSSDNPPGFFTPDESQLSLIHILDTVELVAAIRDDIAHYNSYVASHGGNKSKILSKKVLKQLLLTWGGIAKRGFSRARSNMKVLVTFGLSATHHIIYETMKVAIEEDIKHKKKQEKPKNNDQWPPRNPPKATDDNALDEYTNLDLNEPEFNKNSHFSSAPVFGVSQPSSSKQDVWNPLYNTNIVDYDDTIFSHSTASGKNNFTSESQSIQYETHLCKSVNESANGFCLTWQPAANHSSPINALVGELVGIRELIDTDDPQWGVGVIRWIKHTDSKKLEMGIQKLAPHAISAGSLIIKNIKTPGSYLRTLVLPEIKSINQPMTLIAPNVYGVGNTLSLSIFGDKVSIQLTKLIESTGAFTHFQFASISDDEMTLETDDNQKLDFDDVWSSIK